MKYESSNWYPLDNAGKLYPSIMSWRVTTVFRFSVTLKKLVDKAALQSALNIIINRFPYFQVNLRPGFFWYYFDQTNKKPLVEKEEYYPCTGMELKKNDTFPFRVFYFNCKISVEFTHAITDGTGALVFFKCLLNEYFNKLGVKTSPINEVFFKYDSIPNNAEFEDSFKKHFNPNIPSPPLMPLAFHFPMDLDTKGVYHIVTGILPLTEVLKLSKSYSATITEFLIAIYFETIIDYMKLLQENDIPFSMRPIILNVPVNLRTMYNSTTLRNFFISVTPMLDPRLGDYTFEEIIQIVKSYMNIKTHKRFINQHISKNVKSELFFINRTVPLVIKNLLMPLAYNTFAEGIYTSGLSNLGKITLPKEIEGFIEKFEAYPPPSLGNKIKVVVLSFKENLFISFGKVTTDSNIERIFFTKLRKLGIPIKIETN